MRSAHKKKPLRMDVQRHVLSDHESSDHGGKSGAAARLTKIERATAQATIDFGQREILVPLPE